MSTPITLLPGTLPPGYCYPPDPQTFNVDIVTRIQALLNENFPGIYVGIAEPPADQRDRVWFYPPTTKWYYYISGQWQRQFDIPNGGTTPTAGFRALWTGLEADLATYQGGSAGAVGPSTGPLWEVDHTFDARSLFGPGTLPSTAAISVNTNGGNETHILTQAELPNINFQAALKAGQADGLDADNSQVLCNPLSTSVNPYTLNVPSGGSNTAFSLLPPYRGIFVIKRTSRVYVQPPY